MRLSILTTFYCPKQNLRTHEIVHSYPPYRICNLNSALWLSVTICPLQIPEWEESCSICAFRAWLAAGSAKSSKLILPVTHTLPQGVTAAGEWNRGGCTGQGGLAHNSTPDWEQPGDSVLGCRDRQGKESGVPPRDIQRVTGWRLAPAHTSRGQDQPCTQDRRGLCLGYQHNLLEFSVVVLFFFFFVI